MEDKATTVELSIESAELHKIIQSWAAETKFSVYKKDEKRTYYSRNIGLNSAWLSVENQGTNARINVWLAPRSLAPDAQGNAWTGWKIGIPNGFAIGPVSTYKKQFKSLMEMLESKSENIVTSNSSQRDNKDQLETEKRTLIIVLTAIGIIQILVGMLGIISASTYISSHPDLGSISLKNGIFNMILGALTFICSRMLKNGKTLAIWLYGAGIFFNIIYNMVMGHKFPYFSLAFGAIIIFQLWKVRKEWELS